MQVKNDTHAIRFPFLALRTIGVEKMTQPNESEQNPKMKYNDLIQGIRDRLGKTEESTQTEVTHTEPVNEESNNCTPTIIGYMQKFYGRLLIENSPALSKDIADNVGIPHGSVRRTVNALIKANLVLVETIPKRGSPQVFTINPATPLPEGWPSAEELKRSLPLINIPKGVMQSEQDRQVSARDNPLTRMLLNEGKSPFDTTGYEEFIQDTKKTYGIKELDDVVDVLHKICMERIANKRIDCPICHGKIERNVDELYCKKCKLRLNGGSFERSLEMFRRLAEVKAE